MRKYLAPLLLVAIAVPLGGCSLFGKANNYAAKAQVKQNKAGDLAQTRLTAGREALDKGNWAEAIIAFSEARRDARFSAQAHNGMGVAYAELGRADLAERYFLRAMAEAPDDRRFAANLARLYARLAKPQPVLAATPDPIPALAAPRQALVTDNPAVKVERPAGRLVRNARGELQLHTATASANQSQMANAAPKPGEVRPGVTFTRRNARPQ